MFTYFYTYTHTNSFMALVVQFIWSGGRVVNGGDGGFKKRGPISGVPVIRIIACLVLFWRPVSMQPPYSTRFVGDVISATHKDPAYLSAGRPTFITRI